MSLQILFLLLSNKGAFLAVLLASTLVEIMAWARGTRLRGSLVLAAGFIIGCLLNLIQAIPVFLFFIVSGITGMVAAGLVHFVFSLWQWDKSDPKVNLVKAFGAMLGIALYGCSFFVCKSFVRERQLGRLSLIMSNRNVTPEQLEMIWESAGRIKGNNYHCGVAFNPRTPIRILELASKEPENIRECLAENPSLPQNLFERLAADVSPGVRSVIVLNPATPPALRQRLSADPDPTVQNAVKRYAQQHTSN